ncbi:MAG: hypothetical protein WCY70_00720 [Methanoculleus sp.]
MTKIALAQAAGGHGNPAEKLKAAGRNSGRTAHLFSRTVRDRVVAESLPGFR